MITFDITGTGGFSARVELQEQIDTDKNCSVLEARLYILCSRWLGVTYWLQGQAAGRDFSSNEDHVYIAALNTPALVGAPWSFTVEHEPDGTGSVTVSVNLRGYTADGGYGNGWRVEGSRTVALTPIALASSVTVAEGETTTIAINRRNSSYTHLLRYDFGSLSGYITDSGAVSDSPVVCIGTVISFPIPEAFYPEIPESDSGVCLLTCSTFDGDRQVGSEAACTFRVKVPETYGPVLQPYVADVNAATLALTGDAGVAVRFMSQMQCTAETQGQMGATIVATTVEGQPLPAVVEGAEKLTFCATDSRGYTTQVILQPPVVPYVLLTVNGSCSRVSPVSGSVDLTVRGSCFSGSFGSKENTLTLTASTGGKEFTLTPVFQEDRYEATVRLEELSYEQSHTITVTACDALMTATAELHLGRGVPVFDWGRQDFAFHVPITAPSVNGIKNPALKAWPVGAVIIMPESPAASIGGKWEHFTLPGIDLDAWRRLQGADVLGTAVLGQMVLGTEE